MNKIVLNELRKIEQESGLLTPKGVVNEARDENNPLHKLFDWDNNRAGEKYRLWQARYLISKVKVTIDGRKIDAFHNVTIKIGDTKTQGYVNAETVLSQSSLYSQVIKTALKEIEYWQKKYKNITDLQNVVNESEVAEIKEKQL
jgi:hypothetical protein